MQSITPRCTHHGLGSSNFARRYFRNRVFFLFLRLLRCFSSPGSLPYVMYWRMDTCGLHMWVSPFRYSRIKGYLLLPVTFRSLSRLSSALSAKASTLRSYSLDLDYFHSVGNNLSFCVFTLVFWFFRISLFISRMSWYLSLISFEIKFIFHQKIFLYEVFKVRSVKVYIFALLWRMEMERFELLTPCLQGRCSPNWATPPFGNCTSYIMKLS